MPNNNDTIKKQIFDKEPDEPLTADEQDILDEIIASEQPQEVNIDPNDPIFISAFRLYFNLKKDNIASWEKLSKAIGIDAHEHQFNETEPRPKTRKLLWWPIAAAAVLLIIAGVFLWNSTGVQPAYLTAATGNGEIRTVSLPDGSTVTLSAKSTIIYPEKFTGNERQVKLTGEALFEVKSDKLNPFRVTASEKNIVATGTEFNVKAYVEDTIVEATLIDGVISVDNGSEKRTLKKGEQAIITGNKISINKNVKTENITAWQQKWIIFDGETLPSIMQQIERFYNVKVTIRGTLPEIDLTGKVDASNDLSVILNTLRTNIPEANFEINKDSTSITVAIK
jgi:ferric-dicitrate binding protein FerR (iron transport regulator)